LEDKKLSALGVAEGLNLFDGDDMFLIAAESSEKSNWILDFGCLFHMCSVKEHFDVYQ